MLLCIAMLAGTTFAWFTDSASTGVNKIVSGKLDVALEMLENGEWVSAENEKLSFSDVNGKTDILWEPGATFKLPTLRIANNGSLALKYKVVFSAVNGGEDAMKLASVLDVYLSGKPVGTLKDVLTSTDSDGFAHGNLAAKANSGELVITVKMQESAGNDYKNLSIDGVSVTVFATQDTVEYDSTGNQYDKDADYDIPTYASTAAELTAAVNAANNRIVLTKDIFKTNNHCLWNGKVELDLNGHTVTGVGLTTEDEYAGNRATPIFLTDVQWWTGATEGGELVINGEGTIKSCDTAVRASNGTKITINGGEFIAKYAANGIVDANEGAVVVITGGSFKQIQGSFDYTLRTGSNEETRGTIIVKGGSFYKYDPSAEHPYDTGVSVADGYKVVQDGDWYRVVPK